MLLPKILQPHEITYFDNIDENIIVPFKTNGIPTEGMDYDLESLLYFHHYKIGSTFRKVDYITNWEVNGYVYHLTPYSFFYYCVLKKRYE